MCKAPKPPEPKAPEKPEFLRNAYLDAAVGQAGVVSQLRQGRSGFRIDLDTGLGIGASQSLAPAQSKVAPTPEAAPPVRPISRRGEGRRALQR